MSSVIRDGTSTAMTYNPVNELTQAGSTTYTYDANGNRVSSSAGESASYNAANQTTSYTPAGGAAIPMSYTGSGQAERTYAGATNYQYDATGLRTMTSDASTSSTTALPDGSLISESVGGSTYDYLTDGEGSVVALATSSGQVVNQYSYDPWGKMTSSSGSVVNPYYYHGYQQVDPSGSQPDRYYTGSTFYDATTAHDTGMCDPGEDAGPPGEDEQDLTGAGPGYECPGPGSAIFHRNAQIPGIACAAGGVVLGILCCIYIAHCGLPGSGGRQLKLLSAGDIKLLKKHGINPETLKEEYGCIPPSRCDLYKDQQQWVYVAPKGDLDAAQKTWVNLRALRRNPF